MPNSTTVRKSFPLCATIGAHSESEYRAAAAITIALLGLRAVYAVVAAA